MSTPGPVTPGPEGRNALTALWEAIVAARAREQAELGRGAASGSDLHVARMSTLQALVDYSEALEALSWPVPREILFDIKLHRALCDPGKSGRRGMT